MTDTNEYKQAMTRLHELLRLGSRVYTVNESVARSNMSAVIKVLVVDDDQIIDISFLVGRVTTFRHAGSGLKVRGYGLDRGFEIVYRLSAAMWPGRKFDSPHPRVCAFNHSWL